MYYIIETNYVGPNADQHIDVDLIEIRTEPARTNMSNEPRIEGWCGTTNDWSVHAHGEYETIEAARAALAEKFGEVRDLSNEDAYTCHTEDYVVETYKPGLYEPMSASATGDWLYPAMKTHIAASTTDEKLLDLLAWWETEVMSEGCTLHPDAEDMMRGFRQELRAELANDDD